MTGTIPTDRNGVSSSTSEFWLARSTWNGKLILDNPGKDFYMIIEITTILPFCLKTCPVSLQVGLSFVVP